MDEKGQASIAQLLMIGAAVVVTVIVIGVYKSTLSGTAGSSETQLEEFAEQAKEI